MPLTSVKFPQLLLNNSFLYKEPAGASATQTRRFQNIRAIQTILVGSAELSDNLQKSRKLSDNLHAPGELSDNLLCRIF